MSLPSFCDVRRNTIKAIISPGSSFNSSDYSKWNMSLYAPLTSAEYLDLYVRGLTGIENAQCELLCDRLPVETTLKTTSNHILEKRIRLGAYGDF